MSPGKDSSTTASGHQGTGVGTLDKKWVHFNPPAKGNSRDKHTCFDYDDAIKEIKAAKKTSGTVKVKADIYEKQKKYKCTNCHEEKAEKSLPARAGCKKTREGDHNWKEVSEWEKIKSGVDKDLTYDKSGSKVEVSYHK
jgi:hypothetical protein